MQLRSCWRWWGAAGASVLRVMHALRHGRGAQVMIAACDTFRSGAVEQLKTHCVRLGVPLYERGYEKDPAKVALEGQRAAERNKKDVLLVDTAGAAPRPPVIDPSGRCPALAPPRAEQSTSRHARSLQGQCSSWETGLVPGRFGRMPGQDQAALHAV